MDDYKEAVKAMENSKGCDSLSTYSWRTSCDSLQRDVQTHCKEEAWSCQRARLETRSLREQIANREQHIDNLKREPEKNKQEIADKERELHNAKTSLQTDLSDIDLRIAGGKRCLTARTDTEKIFNDAIQQAERDGRANEEIRPLANRLTYYWKGENDRHLEAHDLVSRGIEYCEECKRGAG